MSTPPQSSTNILIIDDDELVRMTLKGAITKAGYAVIEAKNGTEGVKLFQENTVAIVITDILMPNKEGLETITEIRAHKPEAKIIAISSGGTTKNMSFLQLAKKIGADFVLQKPIKPNELMQRVEFLLKK